MDYREAVKKLEAEIERRKHKINESCEMLREVNGGIGLGRPDQKRTAIDFEVYLAGYRNAVEIIALAQHHQQITGSDEYQREIKLLSELVKVFERHYVHSQRQIIEKRDKKPDSP